MFPNPKTMSQVLVTPLHLAFIVFNAPLSALWVVIQAAIPATIYAQVTAGRDPPGTPAIDRSHMFGSPVAYPAPVPVVPPASPGSPPPDAL